MFYECIGLSTATRLCDIRVVTAMSDVTVRLLSSAFVYLSIYDFYQHYYNFLFPDRRKSF